MVVKYFFIYKIIISLQFFFLIGSFELLNDKSGDEAFDRFDKAILTLEFSGHLTETIQ